MKSSQAFVIAPKGRELVPVFKPGFLKHAGEGRWAGVKHELHSIAWTSPTI